MKQYAILNDNVVTEMVYLDDTEYGDLATANQAVVDVDGMIIKPEVGWILVGNEIKPPAPISGEARLIKTMQMRFKFGNELADSMVQKMSIKNIELIESGQIMNINTVIQAFSGIEMALRKCAIPTAKGGIMFMAGGYPEYSSEFAFALAEITNYLNLESEL